VVWLEAPVASRFPGRLDEMSKQRLLIIGTSGFLGTYAVQSSAERFDVIRGDRSSSNQPGTVQLDVADSSSVNRAFRQVQPNYVLLLAAMSDIDRCEAAPELAFATNARGAEHVANACARANARLLFTSTAAVFDGKKHGYREEAEVSPLSVYGSSKAWAENAVRSLLPSAIVLRFALVLGFAGKSGTNAMLDTVVQKWKAGQPVSFPTRETRNPVDADSLSKIMIGMLANDQVSGLYHVGATDSISRFELGKRLAARAGFSSDLVRPLNATAPGRAPRGEDHFLLTDKIRKVWNLGVQTSDQVIERCFS
jgi:dTDP-4-dehydrorhamnose reductase